MDSDDLLTVEGRKWKKINKLASSAKDTVCRTLIRFFVVKYLSSPFILSFANSVKIGNRKIELNLSVFVLPPPKVIFRVFFPL